MPPFEFCESVGLNHDVCWLVEQRGTVEVETLRHEPSTFPRTAQRFINTIVSQQKGRQKYDADKVGRMIKIMYGTHDASHIWQSHHVTLICAELGGFRRVKHSTALFHSYNEDVRMAVHGDDFVWLSDQSHRLIAQIKILSERHGHTWIRRLGREKHSVVKPGVSSPDRSDWTVDGLELDLRHAPLIMTESGCNANTKTVSTPPKKLQDKLVLNGRKRSILKREDATKYRSACRKLSY